MFWPLIICWSSSGEFKIQNNINQTARYRPKINTIIIKNIFKEINWHITAQFSYLSRSLSSQMRGITPAITKLWQHAWSQHSSLYTFPSVVGMYGAYPHQCCMHSLHPACPTDWLCMSGGGMHSQYPLMFIIFVLIFGWYCCAVLLIYSSVF